jgi:hypothetical protein
VDEACQACVQFQWQDAIPVLNDLIDRPADLRELSFTIPARRELMGSPIPQELRDAKQQIIAAGYDAEQEIDPPRKLLQSVTISAGTDFRKCPPNDDPDDSDVGKTIDRLTVH